MSELKMCSMCGGLGHNPFNGQTCPECKGVVLPSPVRYEDGSISREYDEQPEPKALTPEEHLKLQEDVSMALAAEDYSDDDYPGFEDVGLFAAQNCGYYEGKAKAVLEAIEQRYSLVPKVRG